MQRGHDFHVSISVMLKQEHTSGKNEGECRPWGVARLVYSDSAGKGMRCPRESKTGHPKQGDGLSRSAAEASRFQAAFLSDLSLCASFEGVAGVLTRRRAMHPT